MRPDVPVRVPNSCTRWVIWEWLGNGTGLGRTCGRSGSFAPFAFLHVPHSFWTEIPRFHKIFRAFQKCHKRYHQMAHVCTFCSGDPISLSIELVLKRDNFANYSTLYIFIGLFVKNYLRTGNFEQVPKPVSNLVENLVRRKAKGWTVSWTPLWMRSVLSCGGST